MNEHGVAQVPALKSIPDFNLEQELAAAQHFHLDALTADPKTPIKTRALRREELAALTGGSPAAEVAGSRRRVAARSPGAAMRRVCRILAPCA